jgi:predicted acylesterase/phospholipase RssA
MLTCSRFVCATRTGNTEVAILRSYDTTEPKFLFEECKIWEACRATSAATTFFDPVTIGKYGQRFADGAVLYNNPIQVVEREASTIWPDRMESVVLVSIGTGSAPGGAFKGNLIKIINAMKKIVTQTERTNEDFFLAHQAMLHQNRLYRFNVCHGLADIGLNESKEKEKIANTTQIYLEKAENRSRARSCIEQLSEESSRLGSSPVGELRLAT